MGKGGVVVHGEAQWRLKTGKMRVFVFDFGSSCPHMVPAPPKLLR